MSIKSIILLKQRVSAAVLDFKTFDQLWYVQAAGFFTHDNAVYAFNVTSAAGPTVVYKSTNDGTTWSLHETNPLFLARNTDVQLNLEMHNFPGLSVSVCEYGQGVYLT